MLQTRATAHFSDYEQSGRQLHQALDLAESQHNVRVFLDEGQPMKRHLKAAQARGLATPFFTKLLAAFQAQQVQTSTGEQLSPRELEVLRLLAANMTIRGVSTHLGVSEATVKRYLAMIFEKLQVRNSTGALVIAQKQGLV